MAIEDEVRVRGHGVQTNGALDHTWSDTGKHSRRQFQTIPVFLRPRRSINRVRIGDLPTGVVGNLEPRDTVDGETVDLPGSRVGDEHRETLRFELPRVASLLPPERFAPDVNR